MDIKAAINSMTPIQSRIKAEGKKEIKSGETADRDANGQMAGDGEDENHQPLTDEQLQQALAKLRKMPAVVQQGLQVKLLVSNAKRFIIVQEPTGRVVRRIAEAELHTILKTDTESPKGQLLNKGA